MTEERFKAGEDIPAGDPRWKVAGLAPESFSNRFKRLGTIQPMDCQCLPEITKHILSGIVVDAISDQHLKLDSVLRYANEAPAFAKRQRQLLAENEQYQHGLVTAGDLGLTLTPEYAEETRDKIETYTYLRRMIDSMPVCGAKYLSSRSAL